jgi:hypothetical protein
MPQGDHLLHGVLSKTVKLLVDGDLLRIEQIEELEVINQVQLVNYCHPSAHMYMSTEADTTAVERSAQCTWDNNNSGTDGS